MKNLELRASPSPFGKATGKATGRRVSENGRAKLGKQRSAPTGNQRSLIAKRREKANGVGGGFSPHCGLDPQSPNKKSWGQVCISTLPPFLSIIPRGLALPEGVPVPAHDKSPTARNLTNLYKSYKSILIYLVRLVRFLPQRGTPVFYRRNEIVAADCGSSPQ